MEADMKRIFHLFLGVLGMLLAIALAVTVTLNSRWLYIAVMESEDLENATGYSRAEILDNYDAVINYNSIFGPNTLKLPSMDMSEGGRIHFVEVKNIFVSIQAIGILCLMGLFAFAMTASRKKDFSALAVMRNTGILSVVVPALVGLGVAINWDRAFVIFHKIFFNNDLWLFDPRTDPIITILPDTYFLACAVMIICLVILVSILCLVAYFFLKRKLNNQPTV